MDEPVAFGQQLLALLKQLDAARQAGSGRG